ncbi:unnamed protein product [Acanthosepion pharaonis]|uniref:Uncharacterized protein n=1 Tax=Acanthosepion pharaonis TaxID=158019 RepID=A0A812CNV8_ACAPH|nr:unnamed protein product [Sepia pharaonis]
MIETRVLMPDLSFPISFTLASTFIHVITFHLLPSLSLFLTPFTFILLFFLSLLHYLSSLLLHSPFVYILSLSFFLSCLCLDLSNSLSCLPLQTLTFSFQLSTSLVPYHSFYLHFYFSLLRYLPGPLPHFPFVFHAPSFFVSIFPLSLLLSISLYSFAFLINFFVIISFSSLLPFCFSFLIPVLSFLSSLLCYLSAPISHFPFVFFNVPYFFLLVVSLFPPLFNRLTFFIFIRFPHSLLRHHLSSSFPSFCFSSLIPVLSFLSSLLCYPPFFLIFPLSVSFHLPSFFHLFVSRFSLYLLLSLSLYSFAFLILLHHLSSYIPPFCSIFFPSSFIIPFFSSSLSSPYILPFCSSFPPHFFCSSHSFSVLILFLFLSP